MIAELTVNQQWQVWFEGFGFAMGFIALRILIRTVAKVAKPTAPEL